mgnify:CR=1 FL=1
MLALTNHQSPITNYQLPITNYQSPITNHQLPITNYQLPITNYQLPITNYQLPITNHQLPITPHRVPKSKPRFICLLKKRGPQSKPRQCLFALGRRKAEVRVASTMTESSVCAISLPNAAPITKSPYYRLAFAFLMLAVIMP